jgi:hypothetical protein
MCRTRGWGCGRIGEDLRREAKGLYAEFAKRGAKFAKEGKDRAV